VVAELSRVICRQLNRISILPEETQWNIGELGPPFKCDDNETKRILIIDAEDVLFYFIFFFAINE
jgi:hypothetical protein